jgi:hypothetical protein
MKTFSSDISKVSLSPSDRELQNENNIFNIFWKSYDKMRK